MDVQLLPEARVPPIFSFPDLSFISFSSLEPCFSPVKYPVPFPASSPSWHPGLQNAYLSTFLMDHESRGQHQSFYDPAVQQDYPRLTTVQESGDLRNSPASTALDQHCPQQGTSPSVADKKRECLPATLIQHGDLSDTSLESSNRVHESSTDAMLGQSGRLCGTPRQKCQPAETALEQPSTPPSSTESAVLHTTAQCCDPNKSLTQAELSFYLDDLLARARERFQGAVTTQQRSTEYKGKGYTCELCSSSFTHRQSLRRHVQRSHEQVKFVCPVCDGVFSSSSTLRVHARLHTGDSPYTCEFCSHTFKDRSSAAKHRRIHTKERPYTCSHCLQTFTQSGNLTRHKRRYQHY